VDRQRDWLDVSKESLLDPRGRQKPKPLLEKSLGRICAKIHFGNTESVALTASDLPSSRQLLLPRCDRVSGELGQPNGGIRLCECCLFAAATTKGVFPWICNLWVTV
jgi:hypothetical protein